MAHMDKKKNLRPSILDRLLDNDPASPRDVESGQHQKLKQLRDSVRKDLQNLLNTRFRMIEPDSDFPNLKKSLLNYGLPDLATINITDKAKRQAFIKQLESILITFEPRFKTIKVSYLENSNSSDRTLRFRIDATLYADPSPEVVVFDSILEPVSRIVNVEETSHG